MGGIEFYPQKEFDEDMEDKSDNDKIRVSTQGCSIISFYRHNPVFLWTQPDISCMF